MSKILAFLFLLFSIKSSAQIFPSEIDTTQYSKTMGEVIGKRSDGLYRYFESTESPAFDGVLYATYPDGNIKSWQEYENGIGQGHWINFYENGNMKEWGTYDQNKVEGSIKKYHENGQLQAEGTYREWRVRVGVWRYYSESGTFLMEEDYGRKGDLRDVEHFYRTGKISTQWYDTILEENRKYQGN